MGQGTPGPIIPSEGEGPKITPTPGGPAGVPIGGEPTKAFKPLMEEGGKVGLEPGAMGSPLDLVRGGGPLGASEATPGALQTMMETLSKKTGLLQGEMTDARYNELSPGQRALVEAKTGQLQGHMEAIANYTGTEPPKGPDAGLGQLKKWVGVLTGAQGELSSASGALSVANPGEISAAKMMQVQARLMAADRTINFMSAVVGKSVDFIKQIFQMQI
ncbi:MAG: hypothetical protein AB7F31_00720 [Parachlamydiales bacterium]